MPVRYATTTNVSYLDPFAIQVLDEELLGLVEGIKIMGSDFLNCCIMTIHKIYWNENLNNFVITRHQIKLIHMLYEACII